MTPADALLAAVLGLVVLQRLVELAVSRRHERRLLDRGATRTRPDGLGPLVAVHVALLALLPFEWLVAPWPGVGLHTAILLPLVAAATALRYWAARTLGDHYTVHVLATPGEPLVRHGPYRWTRHPIYVAVFVEVTLLPLAFGAWATALLLTPVHAAALRHRIRIEDALLIPRRNTPAAPPPR